jgi:hypothetical protein
VPPVNSFREISANSDAQVRLAMECDREMWYNIPLFLGADKSTMPNEQQQGGAWETYGTSQAPIIDDDAIYEYLEDFVISLNVRGYPLDRRLFVEVGNEIWNNGFFRAHMYCYGIRHHVAGVNSGKLAPFGLGWLSYRFINLLIKALRNLGREDQVLIPILATQTVWYAQTEHQAEGMVAYRDSLPVNERLLNISDFKVATTSYTNAFQQWDDNPTLLGETFPDRYAFIDRFRELVVKDEDLLRRYIYKSQVKEVSRNDCLHNPSSLSAVAPFGITGPIHNYEGSSHNNVIMYPDFAFRVDPEGNVRITNFQGMENLKVVLANIVTTGQSVMSLIPEIDRNQYMTIWYQTTVSGKTVTPTLASGNPTGEFSISGDGSGTIKVHVIDSLGPWCYECIVVYASNVVTSLTLVYRHRDTLCSEFISSYNKSRYGVSVNEMAIESAALNNIVSTTANFGTLGADDGFLGAWHIADGHNTLATDIRALTWVTYIAPEVPADTLWNNYVDYMSTYTPPTPVFTSITLDTAVILGTKEELLLAASSISRDLGSIFRPYSFASVDFENAKLYYDENKGFELNTVNGDVTGKVNIDGLDLFDSSDNLCYLNDEENNTWYEFNITLGSRPLNFVCPPILNVETETGVFLIGTVHGLSDFDLTGTDVTFSNNGGANWLSTVPLISGVTQFRKSYVTGSTPATATRVPVVIATSDGNISYTAYVDVVTVSVA